MPSLKNLATYNACGINSYSIDILKEYISSDYKPGRQLKFKKL